MDSPGIYDPLYPSLFPSLCHKSLTYLKVRHILGRIKAFIHHSSFIIHCSGGSMVSLQESDDRKPLYQRSADGAAFLYSITCASQGGSVEGGDAFFRESGNAEKRGVSRGGIAAEGCFRQDRRHFLCRGG
jgi:hypothetical protein